MNSKRMIAVQVTKFRKSKYFRLLNFIWIITVTESHSQQFFVIHVWRSHGWDNTFYLPKFKIICFITNNYCQRIWICLALIYQPLDLMNNFYLTANFRLQFLLYSLFKHTYWNFITWYKFRCFMLWDTSNTDAT